MAEAHRALHRRLENLLDDVTTDRRLDYDRAATALAEQGRRAGSEHEGE